MFPPSSPDGAPTPVVRLIPQLIDFAAQRYGASPFLLRHDGSGWQTLTFDDAARAVHAFTALLEREGVQPGDRVALHSENRAEWGLAYLAILEAGAIAVPLDALLKADEVRTLIEASRSSHIVVSARLLDVCIEASRGLATPPARIGLDAIEGLPSWQEAQRLFPNEAPRPLRAQPDDLASLHFTSGTTGRPRGVMLSHTNILSNVEGVAACIDIFPDDRLLSVLPLHHTFECTLGFLGPMRTGAGVAYARGLKSNELREDLKTSGATILLGVPLLYEKLLAGIHRGIASAPLPRRLLARTLLALSYLMRRATGARLGHALLRPLREKGGIGRLRMFVSGAAPLPEEVFWGFADLGIPILEGYGLTETSPVVCANRPPKPPAGGVGPPLPGVEVRVLEPDAEGNGEVVVRGPNVMLGYYEDPEATREAIRDGWFHTGDLGRLTADGHLHITGRIKNMIATAAGKKIYPEEVEAVIEPSPWVLEVVVMGGRDPRSGREEVQAHVVPEREALQGLAAERGVPFDRDFIERTVRADLEQRCERLAAYKRPKQVVFREEPFPRTTTGKIRRQAIVPTLTMAADAVA